MHVGVQLWEELHERVTAAAAETQASHDIVEHTWNDRLQVDKRKRECCAGKKL